jgi:hypothetical protein
MATERLSMRKTKEILRQKWTLGRTNREIACSVSVSAGSVGKTVSRAKAVKLDWAQVQQLDEQQLEVRLYGLPTPPIHNRPLPSMEYIHQEMHKKGVTLQLLHIEYLEGSPDGYKYTQFCEYYRQWPGGDGCKFCKKKNIWEATLVMIDRKRGYAPNSENPCPFLRTSSHGSLRS